MEYNFTEEQKEKIGSLSAEEFVKHLIHSTRAPIHSCISSIELLQLLDYLTNEEQNQIIISMKESILSIKRNHEEMRFWLEINRDKSK